MIELKTCVPIALELWRPGRSHTCERTDGQVGHGFSVLSKATYSDIGFRSYLKELVSKAMSKMLNKSVSEISSRMG